LASGFGSFAFHPDYENNGLFYTNHTEDPKVSAAADFSFADSIPRKVRWVVTEWKQTDPKANSFKGSKREILRVDMVTQIHGMQEIAFNPWIDANHPDYGNLYIGIGDGGAVENGYSQLVQDKKRIWGSILRINPQGNNSQNGNYGIPSDNPYANETDTEIIKEVWARGFRNPHRLFWHPKQPNTLFASGIGHRMIEEVNEIKAGHNYGWPAREGTFLLNYKEEMDSVYALPSDDVGYTYPVLQFDHDAAGAISSGFIYNGEAIPKLKGKFLLGGIVNGRVFYANAADFVLGKQAPMYELAIQVDKQPISTFRNITGKSRIDLRFGYDAANELYIFTKVDGKVYKIIGLESMKK
jgi:glucose/arabinose dehydrogenase